MAKYLVKSGTHYQGKKLYKRGDIIETGEDMVKRWGNKFQLITEGTREVIKEVVVEKIVDTRGDNVSADFDDAVANGLTVFKNKSKWNVYDENENPIAGGLKKGEVNEVIAEYLEPEEDEDDVDEELEDEDEE